MACPGDAASGTLRAGLPAPRHPRAAAPSPQVAALGLRTGGDAWTVKGLGRRRTKGPRGDAGEARRRGARGRRRPRGRTEERSSAGAEEAEPRRGRRRPDRGRQGRGARGPAGTGPPAAHWAARLGAGAGGRAGGTGPGRPGRDGGDGDRGGRTLGRAAGALSRSAAHLLAPTPPARGGPRLKYPAKNSLRGRPPIRAARSSNWANGGARDGEARSRQAGPR